MSTPTSTTSNQRKHAVQVMLTALVAIALLGVTLAALREPAPQSNLAAIVNNDEPVEIEGQLAPMGRQLSAEFAKLNGPFEWQITTADRAEAGLKSGLYTAAVVIPENFSANVTSLSSLSDAVQADVSVQLRPGAGTAEATEVELEVWKATANLGSMLTEEFATGIFGGLGEMSDQLQTAADGASQLADGAEQAQSGTEALADGNRQLGEGAGLAAAGIGEIAVGAWQLADGADQAADGLGQLAAGTDELGGGLDQLASGAGQAALGSGQLAGGLKQLATGGAELAAGGEELAKGADDLSAGADELDQGASDLADGAEMLSGGVSELSDGLTEYVNGVNTIVGPISDIADQINQVVQELAPLLEDATANKEAAKAFLQQLKEQYDAFCTEDPSNPICQEDDNPIQDFWDRIDEIYSLIDVAADELQGLPTQMEEAAEGLRMLEEGGEAMINPNSDQSVPALAAGMGEYAQGVRQYADGMDEFASGLGQYSRGVSEFSTGVSDYTDGVSQIAGGASELAGGIEQLADGTSAAADGVGELSAGAWLAADGVGQLADGTSQLADGAGQAADGVGQLAEGADALADGADQLGEGLEQIGGGIGELAEGLGQAGDAIPAVDEQQAEALGAMLASPVQRPSMAIGTQSGPALGLALLLWLASLLLQSVFPPVVAHLSSSTRSSFSLMLEALRRPAAATGAIGAAGGLILALVGKAGLSAAFALVLFGAFVGVIFAAVQQALATVLRKGWVTASVAALVLGVSAALAPAYDSALSKVAGFLPAGEAADVFSFLLVPGMHSAAGAVLMLLLWGMLALVVSVSATAGKRKTPEAAESAAAA